MDVSSGVDRCLIPTLPLPLLPPSPFPSFPLPLPPFPFPLFLPPHHTLILLSIRLFPSVASCCCLFLSLTRLGRNNENENVSSKNRKDNAKITIQRMGREKIEEKLGEKRRKKNLGKKKKKKRCVVREI